MSQDFELDYPKTRRSDFSEEIHGRKVADPYRWLEEIDSEETKGWLKKQEGLTERFLEGIPHREEIKKRLEELWDYDEYGIPLKRGGKYFYTKKEGLQDQPILYWTDSLTKEGKPLLDPNKLSEEGTLALTGYVPSGDGKFVAYGLSEAGSDWRTWRIRKVQSGEDLEEEIKWTKFTGLGWLPGNRGFFYSRYDSPAEGEHYKAKNQRQKLFLHKLGHPQSEDELIYERPQKKEWGFEPSVTDDGRYLIISVWRGTERENGIFYKDLKGDGEVVELLDQFDASYEFIGHERGKFYLKTDLRAPRGRVIAIDLSRPGRSYWEEVIPQAEEPLESVSLVGERFFSIYLDHAKHRVDLLDKEGEEIKRLKLPGMGTVTGFSGLKSDREAFYSFSSFKIPPRIYRYDLREGESSLIRSPEIPVDAEDFQTAQVFYSSKDGEEIPLYICNKKDLDLNSPVPTYLYGYGGFNISLTPSFSLPRLVWMERGGIYAQANLRGGGEYGKKWHEEGRRLNKQNVFDDFIAAAEWLIEEGFTSSSKLAISGRSNGGLLVGASLTQRPDLFGACVAVVGVLDMLRFHKFTIGWGWVSDYGSPDDPETFEYLLSYSPYHNVERGEEYPPTLVITGDHDDRVFPAHSFKFAAKLQRAQGGSNPVLLKVERDAGHGVGKPTSKLIEEESDILAFMIDQLEWN